jgi:hypothetical protein
MRGKTTAHLSAQAFMPPLARRHEWAPVCQPIVLPRKRGRTTRLHLPAPCPNKFVPGSAGEPAPIMLTLVT